MWRENKQYKHNTCRQQAIQTFIWHLYLAVWTTATRFCMKWPIMSWGESSHCRMLQHASSPEPDVVTTLRRCYVNYTGFLFGSEWSSNSPVWCARRCAVKCLSTWLMTSISSPKATDDPFGLPLITCARYHVRTTALETEALALSAREFGTVCHVACGHLTSATNILKCCWRHICFHKATALCDILYKRLRNILTYLLTYKHLQYKTYDDNTSYRVKSNSSTTTLGCRTRFLSVTSFCSSFCKTSQK